MATKLRGVISWFKAQTILGKRTEKKIACNTTIRKDGESFKIRYHNTDIIEIYMDRWVVRTGGWHTSTTKGRINEWSPARVFQKDFEWFFCTDRKVEPFYDGLQVDEFGDEIQAAHLVD